ncbi:DEAD/DEAH box helicase [bacterium]|nr:DEAD/DEAH box helicase [bacterium]
MPFKNLGLRPEILTGIKLQGYIEPTPIQEKAIPVIIQGHDILAKAQTGTGKTAAFTLPLLHLLSAKGHTNDHLPRTLILAPTRELAAQVGKSIETYGHGINMRSIAVFGGVNIKPQIKSLRKGMDIVIGTPGRLLDLASQKALNLSRIEILILDEADRMLDMGFINDIRKIISMVPKKRQTLFFSATYSKEIKLLADTILNNPILVEVTNQDSAPDTVAQCVYHVPKSRKQELLSHLIKNGNWNQVLVFTKTKHGANRLAHKLNKDGIMSLAIHGNKSQAERTRALANFKDYKLRVLVGTDIAARGLDIFRLPHVVNYDLPYVAEDYLHRIGRTGRAGHEGEAISFVTNEEIKLLRAIERLIKKEIKVKTIEEFSKPIKGSDENENRNSFRDKKPGKFKPSFRDKKTGEYKASFRNKKNGKFKSSVQDKKPGELKSRFRDRKPGELKNQFRSNMTSEFKSSFRDKKPGEFKSNFRDRKPGELKNQFRSSKPGEFKSSFRDRKPGELKNQFRNRKPGGFKSTFRNKKPVEFNSNIQDKKPKDETVI